jgi:hypothetical protein
MTGVVAQYGRVFACRSRRDLCRVPRQGAPQPALRSNRPDAPRDPARAAGVSDHVWEIADIVTLLDVGKAEKRAEAVERSFNPYGPMFGLNNTKSRKR